MMDSAAYVFELTHTAQGVKLACYLMGLNPVDACLQLRMLDLIRGV